MRPGHLATRVCFIALLCLFSTGCVGTLANLIHAGWGNLMPARFDMMAGRRVAVVCMSSSNSFGNSSAALDIAERVEKKLVERVPEIDLVGQQAIEEWMDTHDWNEVDYRELGDGIQTDLLVAVDLDSFSLYEGQTLYKGRANVGMTVYDIPKNKVVYEVEPSEVTFPMNGGQHTADTSESEFRRRFLEIISSAVAKHFYSYDAKEDYGRDPTFVVN